MIRPLNTTQMTSAKPRGGLQSIGELLPRLMKVYELQAQARKQIEEDEQRRSAQKAYATVSTETTQQSFAWYQ